MTTGKYFDILDRFIESHDQLIKHQTAVEDLETQLCSLPGVTEQQGTYIIDFLAKHCIVRDYMGVLQLVIQDINENGIEKTIEEIQGLEKNHDSSPYFFSLNKNKGKDGTALDENEDCPDIEVVSSIIPKSYVMSNTKIANQLTKGFLNNELWKFETAKKNSGKEAPVYACFEFDNDNVNLPKNYTPYDREVFNSVCSLFDAGNSFIWPEQIYRTMTGQTGGDRVSPQAVETIKDSLIKQMFSSIEIDYTEQAKLYRKDKKVDAYRVRGNMLNLVEHDAIINGQKLSGFNILGKPILYEYSQKMRGTDQGQVITVKIDLLNTKKAISNTPDNIVMRAYVVKRIEEMRNPRSRLINKILYDKIFEECQIDATNKVIKKRHRDAIKKILDCFIEKNYIKSYTETKKGKTFDGIEINY